MTIEQILPDQPFELGAWTVEPRDGTLTSDAGSERLEPRVMALLVALAEHGTALVTREVLLETVWPDVVVGEDALARSLLKLRRALGDDARAPRYVETVPRRGYRLLQAPRPIVAAHARHRRRGWHAVTAGALLAAVALALWYLSPHPRSAPTQALLERAHDHYYRFDQAGNESAAALYQRLIDEQPGLAAAKAGLANVLVQRVIRWPAAQPAVPIEQQNIHAAQTSGRLDSPWAQATLDHAERLAREAVTLAPEDPLAHKALGLVLALRQQDGAAASYRRALALDPGMWEAWLNLGELSANAGDLEAALSHYVQAYESMSRRYAADAQRIGRWQAELGALIGETQLALGRTRAAQAWFRQVLEYAPLHPRATAGLAAALTEAGDANAARALCADLVVRIGPMKACEAYLPDR